MNRHGRTGQPAASTLGRGAAAALASGAAAALWGAARARGCAGSAQGAGKPTAELCSEQRAVRAWLAAGRTSTFAGAAARWTRCWRRAGRAAWRRAWTSTRRTGPPWTAGSTLWWRRWARRSSSPSGRREPPPPPQVRDAAVLFLGVAPREQTSWARHDAFGHADHSRERWVRAGAAQNPLVLRCVQAGPCVVPCSRRLPALEGRGRHSAGGGARRERVCGPARRCPAQARRRGRAAPARRTRGAGASRVPTRRAWWRCSRCAPWRRPRTRTRCAWSCSWTREAPTPRCSTCPATRWASTPATHPRHVSVSVCGGWVGGAGARRITGGWGPMRGMWCPRVGGEAACLSPPHCCHSCGARRTPAAPPQPEREARVPHSLGYACALSPCAHTRPGCCAVRGGAAARAGRRRRAAGSLPALALRAACWGGRRRRPGGGQALHAGAEGRAAAVLRPQVSGHAGGSAEGHSPGVQPDLGVARLAPGVARAAVLSVAAHLCTTAVLDAGRPRRTCSSCCGRRCLRAPGRPPLPPPPPPPPTATACTPTATARRTPPPPTATATPPTGRSTRRRTRTRAPLPPRDRSVRAHASLSPCVGEARRTSRRRHCAWAAERSQAWRGWEAKCGVLAA